MIQRVLSYRLGPDADVPLRFLLTAPCFAVLAALVLLWHGPAAFASRWSGAMLAATHLLTLGFLAMTMAGAMLQLIPVVAGMRIPLPELCPPLVWLGLTVGTLLLAASFASGTTILMLAAAALLGMALSILAGVAAAALWRRAPPAALPMVAGMRLALPALALTVLLGVSMAVGLARPLALPFEPLTGLHAAWGLVGWVGVMVASVGFQLIPMFQATRPYPQAVTRALPSLLVLLLIVASAGWDGAGSALAASLAGFAGLTLWMLARRRRGPDGGTRYWRLALACLLASSALYGWQAHAPWGAWPNAQLAIGVLFIPGFAMSAAAGMLYRIVPFLLWYHLNQQALAGRTRAPSIRTLLPQDASARQVRWQAGAVLALLLACVWPQLARPAAGLLLMAALLLARDLARAALAAASHASAQAAQPS